MSGGRFRAADMRTGQLPRRPPGKRQVLREHGPRRHQLQIRLLTAWRRKPLLFRRQMTAEGAQTRHPADSAVLLFFCTIQRLTEALYCREKHSVVASKG